MNTLIIKEEWFEKDYIYYSPKFDQILETCANVGNKTKLYGPDFKLHDYFLIGEI